MRTSSFILQVLIGIQDLGLPFPAGMEIAIYQQGPFMGSGTNSCKWYVVSSHRGVCKAVRARAKSLSRSIQAFSTCQSIWDNSFEYFKLYRKTRHHILSTLKSFLSEAAFSHSINLGFPL